MPTIRNTSVRDLEVAGRIFPAGATVEVGPGEADYLSTNPNFVTVASDTKPDPDDPDKPRRGGKKD